MTGNGNCVNIQFKILTWQCRQTAVCCEALLSRGTLHPIQVAFFLVNALKAPTFEVITVLVSVCCPFSRVDSALSPNMGSKIRRSGLASCWFR